MPFLLGDLSEGHMQGNMWRKRIGVYLYCNTSEVQYLRMIVHPDEFAMDPVKLDGIHSWSSPQKLKDVHSSMGFANFYQ